MLTVFELGHSPPREEGWLRHQKNFGAAHLSAADGVVADKSHSGVSDHPVRSNRDASRHFLNVASTPPHVEGNQGSANTNTFAALPGFSSGVIRSAEFPTSDAPVVTATYCLPPTANVTGKPLTCDPRFTSHSTFPVLSSNALNRP